MVNPNTRLLNKNENQEGNRKGLRDGFPNLSCYSQCLMTKNDGIYSSLGPNSTMHFGASLES